MEENSGGKLGHEIARMIQYYMSEKIKDRVRSSFKAIWIEGIKLKQITGLALADYLCQLFLIEEISNIKARGYY